MLPQIVRAKTNLLAKMAPDLLTTFMQPCVGFQVATQTEPFSTSSTGVWLVPTMYSSVSHESTIYGKRIFTIRTRVRFPFRVHFHVHCESGFLVEPFSTMATVKWPPC